MSVEDTLTSIPTPNLKETSLTEGDLYNSIIAIHEGISEITSVENSETANKTLRAQISVKPSSSTDELESFSSVINKLFSTSDCNDKLLSVYDRLSFSMYVDNEFTLLTVTYNKEGDKFKIDDIYNQNEKYKQASKYLQ